MTKFDTAFYSQTTYTASLSSKAACHVPGPKQTCHGHIWIFAAGFSYLLRVY